MIRVHPETPIRLVLPKEAARLLHAVVGRTSSKGYYGTITEKLYDKLEDAGVSGADLMDKSASAVWSTMTRLDPEGS